MTLYNPSSLIDQLPYEEIRCFACTLQLTVKDGLKDAGKMKTVIAKVTALVCRSCSATKAPGGCLELQPANQPRWNSQLKMLRWKYWRKVFHKKIMRCNNSKSNPNHNTTVTLSLTLNPTPPTVTLILPEHKMWNLIRKTARCQSLTTLLFYNMPYV